MAGESTLQLEYVPIAPAGYKTLFAQGNCGIFTRFHGKIQGSMMTLWSKLKVPDVEVCAKIFHLIPPFNDPARSKRGWVPGRILMALSRHWPQRNFCWDIVMETINGFWRWNGMNKGHDHYPHHHPHHDRQHPHHYIIIIIIIIIIITNMIIIIIINNIIIIIIILNLHHINFPKQNLICGYSGRFFFVSVFIFLSHFGHFDPPRPAFFEVELQLNGLGVGSRVSQRKIVTETPEPSKASVDGLVEVKHMTFRNKREGVIVECDLTYVFWYCSFKTFVVG